MYLINLWKTDLIYRQKFLFLLFVIDKGTIFAWKKEKKIRRRNRK